MYSSHRRRSSWDCRGARRGGVDGGVRDGVGDSVRCPVRASSLELVGASSLDCEIGGTFSEKNGGEMVPGLLQVFVPLSWTVDNTGKILLI
jgi:hypothetical protein